MAVNPKITMLFDQYSAMLTDKEREALDLYYNDDLSLKEIADNEEAERRRRIDHGESEERPTISRQGVRDTIKRAEKKLSEIDSKLNLLEKANDRAAILDWIIEKAKTIDEFNNRYGLHKEISDLSAEIIELAGDLYD